MSTTPPFDGATSTQVDANHPWPGLRAFTERDAGFFKGRPQEVAELLERVQHEPLTVLFGRSGLGKSSLIQAGLFPPLRQRQFLPVYLTVRYGPAAPDPCAYILGRILDTAREHDIAAPEPVAGETLWEYFHRRRKADDPTGDLFWNRQHEAVTPVLVLDQFEEIFTLGEGTAEAARLLEELEWLVENRAPPAATVALGQRAAGSAPLYDFRRRSYKVLISLREDFLPALDGLSSRLRGIKSNRYQLRRMTGDQAFAVAWEPAQHLLDEDTARQIVRAVGSRRGNAAPGDTDLAQLEVEPAFLSVVLDELNRERPADARISADNLGEKKSKIVRRFYDRGMEGVPAVTRDFLERKLLTADGRFRNRVDLSEAQSAGGLTDALRSKLISARIIYVEETDGPSWLWFTHDLLCEAVNESRTQREAERKLAEQAAATREAEAALATNQARNRRLVLYLVVAVILGASIGFYQSWRANQAADRNRKLADDLKSSVREALDQVQKNKELTRDYVVKSFAGELKRNRPEVAGLILAHAREQGLSLPLQESLALLAQHPKFTLAADVDFSAARGVAQMAYSADGRWLAILTGSGAMRLYPVGRVSTDAGEILTYPKSGQEPPAARGFAWSSGAPAQLAVRFNDDLVAVWEPRDAQPARMVRTFAASPRTTPGSSSSTNRSDAAGGRPTSTAVSGKMESSTVLDVRRPTESAERDDSFKRVIVFSPDNAQLLLAHPGGELTVYPAIDNGKRSIVSNAEGLINAREAAKPVTSAVWVRGRDLIATTDGVSGVELWELRDSALQKHDDPMLVLAKTENSRLLVAGAGDQAALIIASSGRDRTLSTWRFDDDGNVDGNSPSERLSNEATALGNSTDGSVQLVGFDSRGTQVRRDQLPVAQLPDSSRVTAVAVHPSGRLIATANSARHLRMWKAASADSDPYRAVEMDGEAHAISPDGRLALLGRGAGDLWVIVNLETRRVIFSTLRPDWTANPFGVDNQGRILWAVLNDKSDWEIRLQTADKISTVHAFSFQGSLQNIATNGRDIGLAYLDTEGRLHLHVLLAGDSSQEIEWISPESRGALPSSVQLAGSVSGRFWAVSEDSRIVLLELDANRTAFNEVNPGQPLELADRASLLAFGPDDMLAAWDQVSGLSLTQPALKWRLHTFPFEVKPDSISHLAILPGHRGILATGASRTVFLPPNVIASEQTYRNLTGYQLSQYYEPEVANQVVAPGEFALSSTEQAQLDAVGAFNRFRNEIGAGTTASSVEDFLARLRQICDSPALPKYDGLVGRWRDAVDVLAGCLDANKPGPAALTQRWLLIQNKMLPASLARSLLMDHIVPHLPSGDLSWQGEALFAAGRDTVPPPEAAEADPTVQAQLDHAVALFQRAINAGYDNFSAISDALGDARRLDPRFRHLVADTATILSEANDLVFTLGGTEQLQEAVIKLQQLKARRLSRYNDYRRHFLEASIFRLQRNFDDAFRSYEAAIDLADDADDKARVWSGRGAAWTARQNPGEALAAYRKSYETYPYFPDVIARIAELSLETGESAAALDFAQRNLQSGRSSAAFALLAKMQFRLGQPEQARATLSTLVQENAADPEAHYQQGYILDQEGKPGDEPAAIAAYGRAIDLMIAENPENAGNTLNLAYRQRGALRIRRNEFPDAAFDLEKAIAVRERAIGQGVMRNHDGWSKSELGMLLRLRGRPEESIEHLQVAVSADWAPNDDWAWAQLAASLAMQDPGNTEAIQRAFDEAVRLDPEKWRQWRASWRASQGPPGLPGARDDIAKMSGDFVRDATGPLQRARLEYREGDSGALQAALADVNRRSDLAQTDSERHNARQRRLLAAAYAGDFSTTVNDYRLSLDDPDTASRAGSWVVFAEILALRSRSPVAQAADRARALHALGRAFMCPPNDWSPHDWFALTTGLQYQFFRDDALFETLRHAVRLPDDDPQRRVLLAQFYRGIAEALSASITPADVEGAEAILLDNQQAERFGAPL